MCRSVVLNDTTFSFYNSVYKKEGVNFAFSVFVNSVTFVVTALFGNAGDC